MEENGISFVVGKFIDLLTYFNRLFDAAPNEKSFSQNNTPEMYLIYN